MQKLLWFALSCAKATNIKGIKKGNAVYKMNTGVTHTHKKKKL